MVNFFNMENNKTHLTYDSFRIAGGFSENFVKDALNISGFSRERSNVNNSNDEKSKSLNEFFRKLFLTKQTKKIEAVYLAQKTIDLALNTNDIDVKKQSNLSQKDLSDYAKNNYYGLVEDIREEVFEDNLFGYSDQKNSLAQKIVEGADINEEQAISLKKFYGIGEERPQSYEEISKEAGKTKTTMISKINKGLEKISIGNSFYSPAHQESHSLIKSRAGFVTDSFAGIYNQKIMENINQIQQRLNNPSGPDIFYDLNRGFYLGEKFSKVPIEEAENILLPESWNELYSFAKDYNISYLADLNGHTADKIAGLEEGKYGLRNEIVEAFEENRNREYLTKIANKYNEKNN